MLELEDEDDAIDRTTSPLQIGHVRRRVVSQGVLLSISEETSEQGLCTYMHSAWNS